MQEFFFKFWRAYSLLITGLFYFSVFKSRFSKKTFFEKTNFYFEKYLVLAIHIVICIATCVFFNEWHIAYNVSSFAFFMAYSYFKFKGDKFSNNLNMLLVACVHVLSNFCMSLNNAIVNTLPLKVLIQNRDVRSLFRYIIQAIAISLMMYILCKTNFLNFSYLKNLALNNSAPLLFVLYFLFSIYLKYKLNNYIVIYDKSGVNTFYVLYLFIIPVFLVTYWLLLKLTALKNVEQNEIYDSIFESVAVVPIYSAKINFSPNLYAYERDKVIFKKELAKLGITSKDCGYSHLVFSLIALKYSAGKENFDIEKDVFSHVSEFLHKNVKTLDSEIGNIIHKVWVQEDIETLKWGYDYNDNVKAHIPTVKEFLIHMVNKVPKISMSHSL